jgi:hypothetical protein
MEYVGICSGTCKAFPLLGRHCVSARNIAGTPAGTQHCLVPTIAAILSQRWESRMLQHFTSFPLFLFMFRFFLLVYSIHFINSSLLTFHFTSSIFDYNIYFVPLLHFFLQLYICINYLLPVLMSLTFSSI